MRKNFWAAALLSLAVLTTADAFAGEATDTVKAKQEQLFKIVKEPKSASQQNKLKALFDEMLAYDDMAKASLGKKWEERTAAERNRFGELLTELVRNNYRRNLKRMLDYKINYVSEESVDNPGQPCVVSKAACLVKTLAKHKTDERSPDLEIDFKVATVGGKLMVIDIFTERASLVKTYKSQFLRILEKDGFDKLIEKMQKKLDKLNGDTQ